MKNNILWIEDFDNKSSRNVRKRTKEETEEANRKSYERYRNLFKDVYKDVIEIKTTMYAGLKYIMEHYGEFDCVILDINMKKNLKVNDSDEVWKFLFKNINIARKEDIDKEIGENAGFYIFLLLITLGFPRNRVLMFTAYGISNSKEGYNPVEKWRKKCEKASMHIPKIIDKGDEFTDNIDGKESVMINDELDRLYCKDGYYYTRLFLFKLYNIVKGLENERYEPLFNKICINKKKIDLDKVIDLINNVINFFPCVKVCDLSNVFYNALKYFSEPFEADYIKKGGGRLKDDTYRLMKIFRNWSSHNLFDSKSKLDDKLFRFFFFIEFLLFSRNEDSSLEELNTVSKIFFDSDIVVEDENLVKNIERRNWNICKEWEDIPKDMIYVYEKRGRNADVMEVIYLLDIYFNCCVETNILYGDISFKAKYDLLDRYKNNSIDRDLFKHAIKLYNKYSE